MYTPKDSARTPREQRRKKKRARTNAGMFLALQADYRAGRLSEAAGRRFEDAVAMVWRTYREAAQS